MQTKTSPHPDAAPAHALWVQLVTRVSTQPLHYRSGEEEAAATSVFSLFQKARDLLQEHPDAQSFRGLTVSLLNDTLRPYTARWRGWMTEDKERRGEDGEPVLRFRDEQVRRQFRQELNELQDRLAACRQELARLAGIADTLQPRELAGGGGASLGATLTAGIQDQVAIRRENPDGPALVTAEQINAAERKTILDRRRVVSGQEAQGEALTNATGLALSGGGIRSATFCLGIVQVLVRKGLLPHFDYLSTVSGGGYFGSFLSCALGTTPKGTQPATTPETVQARVDDVFHRQKGIESGLLRHLRNNSKYLLGGGLLGKLSILGLLISGVLWNVMILLPIPLGAALLAWWAGPSFWGATSAGAVPALPDLTGSVSGWSLLLLVGALTVGWVALPGIQLLTHGKPPRSKPALIRSWLENLTVWLGLGAVIAGALYVMPALFHGHEWLRQVLAKVSLGQLNLERIAGLLPASATATAGAVVAALAGWLGPKWPRLRALAVKLFILSGPLLFLFVFLLIGNRLGLARPGDAAWSWWVVLGVTAALAAWDWLCVNINTLAPHRYYRRRLCDCYLARRVGPDEAAPKDCEQRLSGETVQGRVQVLQQVPLSSLGASEVAPYHLINMTLNVPSSSDKNLRGRGSDFFFASRHFYGSPLTGYAATAELERVDPHFDLGTAMAVSGAAASTTMGWQTVPHFRFLMTLFNVRLGYWIRRPGVPDKGWFTEGAGPYYLFRELLGAMSEQCRYVNLSDGGHIENLAAYELLRRRCKFIVCVDAGHEPKMECSDLMRLQRYAEIDLGLRLHFDIGDLQIGSNGLSRAHAILVKIDYAPETADRTNGRGTSDQLGWMLYLKLAMTGVEPNHVKDYRRQNDDFPHQSTGDQIYEEEQFEAYRALGECALEGFFREEIVGDIPPADLRAWFQHLADKLLPDNDEAFRVSRTASPP